MTKFEKKEGLDYFSVSIKGDKVEYIATIKSLLSIMSGLSETSYVSVDNYYICNLIEGLLPSEEQIISIEDAEYLEAMKQQNNLLVSSITDKL